MTNQFFTLTTFLFCAGLTVGCAENTTKPSGATLTGIDATDAQCKELKRDLEKSIDETISELKSAGMDASMIPSRSELKKQFEAPLKANGCSGY